MNIEIYNPKLHPRIKTYLICTSELFRANMGVRQLTFLGYSRRYDKSIFRLLGVSFTIKATLSYFSS